MDLQKIHRAIYEKIAAKAESTEMLFHLGKVVQGALLTLRGVLAFHRSRVISEYFTTHQVRKLQLGSGAKLLEGWLNTDCSLVFPAPCFVDVTRTFPLKEGVCDYVFTEHLLEHLTFKEGQNLLRESLRVLKPGGRIRVACPDLQKIVGLYGTPKTESQMQYIKHSVDNAVGIPRVYSECFVINNAMRSWGHKFLYDRPTLRMAMELAGFDDVKGCEAGESDDPELQGLESRGPGYEAKAFETMVMEGIKPGRSRSIGGQNGRVLADE